MSIVLLHFSGVELWRPDELIARKASGVANPKMLDMSLLALRQAGLAHMQSRIYLIDADQFGGLGYADTEDLVDHAAASDHVVLNKSDLAGVQRLTEIADLLAKSAPRALVHRTSYGKLSFEAFSMSAFKTEGEFDVPQGVHQPSTLYETFAFEKFPPLPRDRLAELTKSMKRMCLRAKGGGFS